MKSVLITGGSHAELPMIRSAKQLGYYVITTGANDEGIGHREADKYIKGDYSDKEFVYKLAKENKVDAIVSGCNDFAYLSTAYACEKLGLPGHDSYEKACIIHHKDNFRKLTASLGIRTPKMMNCMNIEDLLKACDTIGYPVVIKPVDLTGGKGVLVCQNNEEAVMAYHNAMDVTRESEIIVEEYINGTNHGASVLLKNGKVVFGFVDNEQYYHNKYLVSGACFPSDVAQCTMVSLFQSIEKIAGALQLVDGLFHTQFIVEENGEPVMIDPCRRAPGDLYILLVKYASGVDYSMEIVKAECGKEMPDCYAVSYHNIARQCIMADSNGTYDGIRYDSSIKERIFDQIIWARDGEEICDYQTYKAGIVFFECDTYSQLYKKVEDFHDLVKIDLK